MRDGDLLISKLRMDALRLAVERRNKMARKLLWILRRSYAVR